MDEILGNQQVSGIRPTRRCQLKIFLHSHLWHETKKNKGCFVPYGHSFCFNSHDLICWWQLHFLIQNDFAPKPVSGGMLPEQLEFFSAAEAAEQHIHHRILSSLHSCFSLLTRLPKTSRATACFEWAAAFSSCCFCGLCVSICFGCNKTFVFWRISLSLVSQITLSEPGSLLKTNKLCKQIIWARSPVSELVFSLLNY